jgi:hypothetical protein
MKRCFWLFPKIKSYLKGRRLQDIEDIQKSVTTVLKIVHTTGVPKLFPAVAASLGQMHRSDPFQ